MSPGEVFLVGAPGLAEALPDRWWVPSPEHLQAVIPGRALAKVLALEAGEDGGGDLNTAAVIWMAVDRREEAGFAGTITSSRLDRPGYRVGDRITVPVDRVFDVIALDDDGRPQLNEARTRFAIGKRVLVGVTFLDAVGELVEQQQFVGTVASVDPTDGIEVVRSDGTSYWLPPDGRALEEAPAGEYSLRSTGEVVVDPDYLSTWTITHGDGQTPRDTGYR